MIEDRQIVVWIGQEEKIVSGLTKHTTSEDVVEALLEEYKASAQKNCFVFGSHNEYCIMESWKNVKHILPPSLKMLKRLKSWGVEQSNVRFFLLKTCTSYPYSMWWTSQKNTSHDYCRAQYNALHVQDFPLHVRKKIVRKAFRKLKKIREAKFFPKENNIQQLIQILRSQEIIIKQQMDRMEQLDSQLETYDSCQQKLEKMAQNGDIPNVERTANADVHKFFTVDRFLENDNLENLMQIQEKLNYQHTLIRKLSEEIKVEMSSLGIADDEDFVEEGHTDMVTGIKQEIEESLQVGIRLHRLYSYIQKEIQYNESKLLKQKKEYELLKDELSSICAGNSSRSLCKTLQQHMSSDESSNKEIQDTSTVLSTMDIQNDTDSDTGISSTHSQDSEAIQ